LFLHWRNNNDVPHEVGDVNSSNGSVGFNLSLIENVSSIQVDKAISNMKLYGYTIGLEYKLQDGNLFGYYPDGINFFSFVLYRKLHIF
jgi:hypothetical protein